MRQSTIVYILIMAILVGAYYYLNNRPETVDLEPGSLELDPSSGEYLFSPEDGIPSLVRVESREGDIVEVTRNEDNIWLFTLPYEGEAEQGGVEASVSQVSTIQILDHIPGLNRSDVGLDHPNYLITIEFTSGVKRTLKIGVLTPTESGYYADGEGDTLILNRVGVDALTTLLAFPPYAATLTPSPESPEIEINSEATGTPAN